MDATKTLRQDPFMIFLTGTREESKAAFVEYQRRFRSGELRTQILDASDDATRVSEPAKVPGSELGLGR